MAIPHSLPLQPHLPRSNLNWKERLHVVELLRAQYLHVYSVNTSNTPYRVLAGTTRPKSCKVLSVVSGT